MARVTIDELLAAARGRLLRLTAVQARQAMGSGAVLIDVRAESQVARDGAIAGALVIARNVLEWRLDLASSHRHPHAPELDDHVIVLCDQGYQSSLAAAMLHQLGFARATDVDGGFQAWRDAALPTGQPAPPGPAHHVPCVGHGGTWPHDRQCAVAGLSRLDGSGLGPAGRLGARSLHIVQWPPAGLLYLAATGGGRPAVIAVIIVLYPAITILLARILLHERWTRSQVIGLIAAGAVAAITVG